MKLCGAAPIDLGHIDLSPVEMMAWLYCPIKLPGAEGCVIPPNLRQFSEIVRAVYLDAWHSGDWTENWLDKYIYLTAKTLWVTPEAPGNRPGWHCDGYGSDDLNYVWADCNPTLFFEVPGLPMHYSEDHKAYMLEMTQDVELFPHWVKTYPDKHLLRMDEHVIHNVAPCPKPGFRSFVKVSVSNHRYLLAGNSVNHELPAWTYEPRGVERNDTLEPLMKAGDRNYDASRSCDVRG